MNKFKLLKKSWQSLSSSFIAENHSSMYNNFTSKCNKFMLRGSHFFLSLMCPAGRRWSSLMPQPHDQVSENISIHCILTKLTNV